MSGVFRGAVRQLATSTYDSTVEAETGLVAYWRMDGTGTDLTGNGHTATIVGGPALSVFPNGEPATVFDGVTQYLEVADHNALSVPTTGRLTVEAWIRPDVNNFTTTEGSGPYVWWAGKLGTHNSTTVAEYGCRMYNFDTPDITPARPNRISGYCFNPTGGQGVGSYFQDVVTPGQWIHYVFIQNTVDTSGSYPTGYTKVYKNGAEPDQDSLSDLTIVPVNGTAPFRIGTATLDSFFLGAIAKVAIYNVELSSARALAHYHLIVP